MYERNFHIRGLFYPGIARPLPDYLSRMQSTGLKAKIKPRICTDLHEIPARAWLEFAVFN
jgi:hypothetical protein